MLFSKMKIYKYQELGFDIFITLTYVLLFLYIFGISNSAKRKVEIIDKYVIIYMCLFLMYRFNPFKKSYEFTSLDRKIAFSAGLFIFTTSFLGMVIL